MNKPNTVMALGALEFNTKLARLLQRLKKDIGATSVKQNYRGTGSQKHRRQIWVRCVGLYRGFTDLWLNSDNLEYAGVGDIRIAPLPYGDLTPEEVYKTLCERLVEYMSGLAHAREAVGVGGAEEREFL